MITLNGLTKRYGAKVAVDDLTLSIRPGAVTGFLGPNGAGKSTTMRMVLGLDHPTAGAALVHGVRYADLKDRLRVIGALLDARAVHPGGGSVRICGRRLAATVFRSGGWSRSSGWLASNPWPADGPARSRSV